MDLRPVRTIASPSYPAARARRGWTRRLSRAAAVASVSVSVWLGGCYGAEGNEGAQQFLAADPPIHAVGVRGLERPPEIRLRRPVIARRPTLELCEPDYRLSGDVAPTHYFACGATRPEETPVLEAPQYLIAGQTCEAATAWLQVDVLEPMRARFSMQSGSESVVLALIDPEGVVAAELGPDSPCVEIDAASGRWTLAATPVDPDGGGVAYFELSIDDAEAE